MGSYRYGFNGKENDNEVKGVGNQIDYGERMYDPRVGRFMRVDPLSHQYPELTPYQFDGNSPITFIDQDGLEMMYKLPDGRIYIPPPSDHLRIPVPIGATAIPPQTGTHKGNLLENSLVDFLTPLAEGINNLVGGASTRRRKVVTISNGKVKSRMTTTTTRGASVGRVLSGIGTIFQYSPAEGEGGGGNPGEGGGGAGEGPGQAYEGSQEADRPQLGTSDDNEVGQGSTDKQTQANSGQNSGGQETSGGSEATQNPDPAPLKPEAKYLGSKKHGVNWKEGAATAKSLNSPEGQWSKADLDFAAKKAATLKPGETGTFELPAGSTSKVYMPDGSVVPATHIWIRNNGTGTFHGYPKAN